MARQKAKEVNIIMSYQKDEEDDAERVSNATVSHRNSRTLWDVSDGLRFLARTRKRKRVAARHPAPSTYTIRTLALHGLSLLAVRSKSR